MSNAKRKKTSSVWLYFSFITDDTAQCDICHNTYSHKAGTTSNLRKHLKAKHPTIEIGESTLSPKFITVGFAGTKEEEQEQQTGWYIAFLILMSNLCFVTAIMLFLQKKIYYLHFRHLVMYLYYSQ